MLVEADRGGGRFPRHLEEFTNECRDEPNGGPSRRDRRSSALNAGCWRSRRPNTTCRALPSCLAAYIAKSASLTSRSAANVWVAGHDDADADRDAGRMTVDRKRLVEGAFDARGDPFRGLELHPLAQQSELVAAKPRQGVAGSHGGAKARPRVQQQAVARLRARSRR